MVNKNKITALFLVLPGCLFAQNKDSINYAISLLNGCNGRIDYTEGIRILKEYAVQGDVDALNGLGICYLKGLGVMKNDEASYYCFTEAAQQNCGKSWLNLGYLYSSKSSQFYSDVNAKECFLKAIDCGCQSAIYPAACTYYYNMPVDYAEAYKLFYRGAQYSQPECMYMLGLCNMYGQGTERDYRQAEEWLKNARLFGVTEAQVKLAELDSLQFEVYENTLNLQILSATSSGDIVYSFESQENTNYNVSITSSLYQDRHFNKSFSCVEGTNKNSVATGFSRGVYTICVVVGNKSSYKTFFIK